MENICSYIGVNRRRFVTGVVATQRIEIYLPFGGRSPLYFSLISQYKMTYRKATLVRPTTTTFLQEPPLFRACGSSNNNGHRKSSLKATDNTCRKKQGRHKIQSMLLEKRLMDDKPGRVRSRTYYVQTAESIRNFSRHALYRTGAT